MYDSIQDLRAFSQKIFDVVTEYLEDNNTVNDIDGVYVDSDLEISVITEAEAEDKDRFYPIKNLVREENGVLEADGEETDEVASHYYFVR
jgi:hypothetical protein